MINRRIHNSARRGAGVFQRALRRLIEVCLLLGPMTILHMLAQLVGQIVIVGMILKESRPVAEHTEYHKAVIFGIVQVAAEISDRKSTLIG
ncbi:MAG: hypothetical protein C7B46_19600 [Sulfobacillus benefaciens]|uniref:Uncharacterized protein n=1 Tax=Sulfobacillus benefaciens TaxID=453960 RepID=A0A2T2WY33_9FIRM|nr:MAG: hypothetical protein C7B46_19600 [Sulfobacillus benefaciens]